ncbi:uncharacterized protein FFB14_00800 [Fusarium fujikuroi]|nr:uncharacterized protein FFB14_00800 [Fusarium fujikuroi]
MAVLNRGIPKQQYMRVDEKVLHWIGVRKPAKESPSNLGYQSLLLALSDQMLAVGLCYLIAIVEVVLQETSKASPLAWWLDDVVPRTPRGNPDPRVHHTIRAARQAISLRPSISGIASSRINECQMLLNCCDAGLCLLERFPIDQTGQLSKIRTREQHFQEHDPTMDIFGGGGGGQREVDFQTYWEHEKKDKRQRTRRQAAILEQSPEFWKTFTMVTPLIVAEMAASVMFELLVAIFSFSIALYTLVIGVFYQGADVKPLLTASFGQIMPMLLLIVIALTAVEVSSESVCHTEHEIWDIY